MNILVTGAKGMVGTALVNNLKNIRDGKNKTRNIKVDEIYEYDLNNIIQLERKINDNKIENKRYGEKNEICTKTQNEQSLFEIL